MGAGQPLIVPLTDTGTHADDLVGGKARTLGRLITSGYRVPAGFCISVWAYERFVATTGIAAKIQMELGRKSFAGMRWEEIWDAALRIRSAFLAADMPADLAEPITAAFQQLNPTTMAVRSSAPGEDSSQRSYAGLHESLVGVKDAHGLLDAVRIVWASLWSDAALLYRQELELDVSGSRMAVVVQEFVAAPVSGVGFGIDPRLPGSDRQVVEAVPGQCEDLVSGAVDPDRWIMKRSSGEIVEWRPGQRSGAESAPILAREDLALLHETLHSVETLLGSPPDMEWTGDFPELTLLQARPVTTALPDDQEREWFLSLRPGDGRLSALCERVTRELIPALEAEGARFAAEEIGSLTDPELADTIATRQEALERWKVIYKDEFIPFAHGVRRLGMYYNDAVRPEDPYEFVGILEHQPMIASERNAALSGLAAILRQDEALVEKLAMLATSDLVADRDGWQQQARDLDAFRRGPEFRRGFEDFLDRYMNLTFKDESLDDRPELVLKIVLELTGQEESIPTAGGNTVTVLEQRLLEAVGPERREEALEVLRIGRLSWQLRDDDNILMGRLQNQLQHALNLTARRLQSTGRLDADARVGVSAAGALGDALRDPEGGPVSLPARPEVSSQPTSRVPGTSPRQMIGQPAAPGLATGNVRVVRDPQDFGEFRRGEVMVCDAIQPTMTHLVPLASAIVERRGGMLIHGAIIARELGVPCVNGVADAAQVLQNGDLVTVDGYLGIVTVGPPEFDLEREDPSVT